jgi:hypothetical protein
MPLSKTHVFLYFFVCSFSLSILAKEDSSFPAYNEVEIGGRTAPALRAFKERTGRDPMKVLKRSAEKLSSSPLGDQIKILPMPWVLAESEYQFIKSATVQRATALRLFFEDVFFRKRPRIFQSSIGIKSDWVANLCRSEIQRSYDVVKEFYRGRDAQDISFTYGPDLARLRDGSWTVIEDNLGNVGGRADTAEVHKAFREATGLPPQTESEDDFARALKSFLTAKGVSADKALVLIEQEVEDEDKLPLVYKDLENQREAAAVRAAGLGERIFDVSNISSKKLRELIQKIEDEKIEALLLVDQVGGAWEIHDQWMTFLGDKKELALFNSPHTSVLSSKALMPYMDAIIEFYTGSKALIPTMKSIPVMSSADMKALDERLGPKHIVKTINGSQGEEVYPREHYSEKHWQAVIRQVEAVRGWSRAAGMPFPFFIAQPFVEFSYLPTREGWLQFMLDLRPITYVFGEQMHVAEVPWARANLRMGNNLTNVSQGAFEVAVYREKCEGALL